VHGEEVTQRLPSSENEVIVTLVTLLATAVKVSEVTVSII